MNFHTTEEIIYAPVYLQFWDALIAQEKVFPNADTTSVEFLV